MTRGAVGARPIARWTIASANIVSATIAVILLFQELAAHARPASSELVGWLSHSQWVLGLAWLVVGVSMIQFGRKRAPLVFGVVGLMALEVLVASQTLVFGGAMRVLYSGGATLLGWLIGLGYARWTSEAKRSTDERLAEAGALGCFAATYLGAAVSKLASSGVAWLSAAELPAVILSHSSVDPSIFTVYGEAVVHRPWLAQALVAATLVIQLGAVLMLFSTRLRAVWSVLILLFHLNVFLILHIPYIPAMMLAVGLAYPWGARRERRWDISVPAHGHE